MKRENTSIKTHSGIRYDFLRPTVKMIKIHDIMWSLAKENRFQNFLDKSWSVLQHSLLVFHLTKLEGGSIEQQYIALHHDDPEAYLRDMATPAKSLMRDYQKLYSRCEAVIAEKFSVVLNPLDSLVHQMDKKAMQIEDTIFGSSESEWHPYNIDQYNNESNKLKNTVKKLFFMLPQKQREEYLKYHTLLCPKEQLIS